MKALSLWQPWASAIAEGYKLVETRSWYTPYRGPLVIHAAKCWQDEQQDFYEDMETLGIRFSCPRGVIVATCQLVDVVSTRIYQPSEQEQFWGNYGLGRYAWIVTDVHKVSPAVPWRGQQGLFDVTLEC